MTTGRFEPESGGDLLDALAGAVRSLERVEAQAKDAGASDQGRAELRAMRERLEVIGEQIQNYRRRQPEQ